MKKLLVIAALAAGGFFLWRRLRTPTVSQEASDTQEEHNAKLRIGDSAGKAQENLQLTAKVRLADPTPFALLANYLALSGDPMQARATAERARN